jgi:protein-L-isoaspartate(D-aspartate) O-methyltransferase
MRRLLAKKLAEKGIQDAQVLEAIAQVPRHIFLDPAFVEQAYQDKAFPIGEGQTISQPYTVAVQSQLLEIKKGDKVLEIGTGSGYQACVLHFLGAKVYTIEYNKALFLKTSRLLKSLGYSMQFYHGDGSQGWPSFAPYDKIIVTAGAPSVPHKLMEQLAPKGILVIPVGDGAKQCMLKIVRHENGTFTKEEFGDFRFVPLLGKDGWPRA